MIVSIFLLMVLRRRSWEIFRNEGFVLTATGWMSGCLDRSKGFMRGQGKKKMDDGLV